MEDVLTELPPPSRFFLEDLNNFSPPSPSLPPPFIIFYSNPNPNPNPSLLIIAISPPSLYLLHHATPKTLIGTLFLPEIPAAGNSLEPSLRDKSCNIYSLDSSPSAILITVQYSVTAERSHDVARSLLEKIHPEKILILDSIQSRNFRGKLSVDETLTYKLETSKQRFDLGGPMVRNLDYLPSGSVIDGLAAAILAQSQIRKIKGTLCVSWPDSGDSAVPVFRSLMKDVLPELGFGVDDGSYRIWNNRIDSDLYT
ncbi:trigger factor [Tasmannia lanceolata]|uniref:trigger factor n=1 Tax=Tasmannia lanceolata TaxID=3420 RepID=UPI00406290E4